MPGDTQADSETSGGGAELADRPPDGRNAVSVHFAGGDVAHYAFVVRQHGADWLYAERLVGSPEGLADEEIEAINAREVVRIASAHVHLFDDGVIHFGEAFVADPAAVLADSWFEPDGLVL